MHRQFLTLYLHGKFCCIPSELLRSALGSLCQDIPYAFPLGDHLHHLHHGFGVAELELNAARILVRYDTILVAVHGKGDRRPGTDRIQTVGIARLVALRYGLKIIDPAQRAESTDRLILRTAVYRIYVVGFADLNNALASYGAGETGVVARQDGFRHGRAADIVRTVKLPLTEIVGGQYAHLVEPGHPSGSAVGREPLHSRRKLRHPLGDFFHLVRIGEWKPLLAPHGNGLQHLGAHDGPETAATVVTVDIVTNGGRSHQLLSGDPDLRHPYPLVAKIVLNLGLYVGRQLPPETSSIPDFHIIVIDADVYRLVGFALNNDPIPSRAFQFRTPVASGLRITPAVRKWRLRSHAISPTAGSRDTGHHPRREYEFVVRAQRIDSRFEFLEQIVTDKRRAPDICAVELVVLLLNRGASIGKVHSQDLAGIPGRFILGHRHCLLGS